MVVGQHKPVNERFWANTQKAKGNGCWLWTGRMNWRGYGEISIKNKFVKAHRFAYELMVGPIPEGLEIDHLCRVRYCVNPKHLEAVTHKTNVLRGTSPSAKAAQKTECPQGHPYSVQNTQYTSQGWRRCKICRKAQQDRFKSKQSTNSS